MQVIQGLKDNSAFYQVKTVLGNGGVYLQMGVMGTGTHGATILRQLVLETISVYFLFWLKKCD